MNFLSCDRQRYNKSLIPAKIRVSFLANCAVNYKLTYRESSRLKAMEREASIRAGTWASELTISGMPA